MKTQTSIRHQLVDIRQQINNIIAQLTNVRLTSDEAIERTIQIGALIDSLPFPTDHYATAKNRLRNAQLYFICGEIGAARYELRLLLGQLGRTFI
jgi:hypothetical protein